MRARNDSKVCWVLLEAITARSRANDMSASLVISVGKLVAVIDSVSPVPFSNVIPATAFMACMPHVLSKVRMLSAVILFQTLDALPPLPL